MLTSTLMLVPLLLAADPLAGVQNRSHLDKLIAATTDAGKKQALRDHAEAIVVAVARKPHVDAVVATLEKANGTFEKSNTMPEALKTAIGASTIFDGLRSINLADSKLGIKAKREVDPFDKAFYERVGELAGLEELVVVHTAAENAWLAPLGKLTSLKILRFVNQAKLNDEGLAHLAGLRQIERFGYIGTAMTGEAFENFKGWTNLKSTSHRGSRMSDAGLIALVEAFPNLESLVLAHGQFSDTAVEHLAKLTKLTGLEIGSPKAKPACLKHIAGLPLAYLQLGDGLDASEGIAIIKEIKTLKRLTLTNVKNATDDDLKSVTAMKHLEHVELSNLPMTESQLKLMKEFAFLKSMRVIKSGEPYPEATRTALKALLPDVALKFE